MKVLIVSNNVFMKGNGVCSAVVALRSRLISRGIDVRVLTCENPDKDGLQPDYPLKHFVFPMDFVTLRLISIQSRRVFVGQMSSI